jgi:hypothetical protein
MFVTVALATMATALVSFPEPAAAARPRVLLIGDSTLAALDWYPASKDELAGLDYTLRAASCRAVTATSCVGRTDSNGRRIRPDNALTVLRSYGAGAFDELVLMVGYDESATAFARSVAELPHVAADLGIDHITWLTFRTDVDYVPPADDWSYRGNNRLLKAAASSSGGFIDLVDWNGYVNARDGLVERDGVHLTARGAKAAAALIRQAVVGHWGRSAVSGSSSSSSSSSSSGSSGAASASGERMTLSYGVVGEPVKVLQRILLRIGSDALEPYGATGKYYAATRRAVREFQASVKANHDASMVVDGVVGPVTWRWLDQLDPG